MAEIFLARASAMHGFEKLVVIKRILPQHAESDDFIRMFLAEARLAATLHHPNIVQVYDIGEASGMYFFAMEYVQGQDMRKLVRAARRKQKPIPLEHILHIIMGVAGGLHHAHEKVGLDGRPVGIVHRDVSPSNVLVTYEGAVKIVDFGIAKAATAQVSTIAGTLKGKIPYMSPEQCRGETVDRRSDIFSIGTLLWELTTGKRLFAGDNEFAILNRVAKGDVPLPSSIRPEYPPELEAIVMRALQADPDNRYSSALDLQIDLEDFSREARLPVSSARMGRFMRDLFEEEIRKSQAEVQEETRVEPQASLPGHTIVAPPGSPFEAVESHDLTPSEVRQYGGDPTPGLVHEDYSGSGTDIAVAVPGRRGVAPLLVGAGFVLTLGIGGALYMTMGDTGPEAGGAAVDVPTEKEIIAPEPEPEPEADPPEEPAPVPTLNDGISVPGEEPAHPDGGAAGDASPEETPAEPAGGPEGDSASTPDAEAEGDDKKESAKPTKGKRHKSGKRTSSKPTTSSHKPAPTTKPKPKKERPKYDKNSVVPPGMSFDK